MGRTIGDEVDGGEGFEAPCGEEGAAEEGLPGGGGGGFLVVVGRERRASASAERGRRDERTNPERVVAW